MVVIGLRYCGGCNQQIDRTDVVERFKDILKKKGWDAMITNEKGKPHDVLLLINGCIHGCLQEEFLRLSEKVRFITVKGEMVGDNYVNEESIPQFLAEEIMRMGHFRQGE
jgi:hypothetical protein